MPIVFFDGLFLAIPSFLGFMTSLRSISPMDWDCGIVSGSILLPWVYIVNGDLLVSLSLVGSMWLCIKFHHLSSSLLRFRLFLQYPHFLMSFRSYWTLLRLFGVINVALVFIFLLCPHFIASLFSIVAVCM